MQLDSFKSFGNRKLENALFASVLLFIYKILVPVNDAILFLIISELLILIGVFTWLNYVSDFVKPSLNKPISLVINSGILNAVIFFIISISSWLFEAYKDSDSQSSLIYVLYSILLVFVVIGTLTYIFAVYKSLCFHRQRKDPSFYFNTMVIFFILTALASSFTTPETELRKFAIIFSEANNIFYNLFYVASIIFIVINSLRVAWIAFLNKKQKVSLLIISIVITALSWINFTLLMSDDFLIIRSFSPALEQLLSLTMFYGGTYFTIVFFTTLFHLPTAEVIDRTSEELTSVKELSKLMNQVFDFEELSESITSTTLKVSNSDSAWIVIGNGKELNIHSNIGIGLVDANLISKNLINSNFISDSEVKIYDTSRLPFKDSLPKQVKTFVTAPLKIHNVIKGYLFSARKTTRDYELEDSKIVGTFADFAAVALENAKLLKESIEKERLEKELDLAREVQYKILPQQNPEVENLEIASLFIPAFEVGGDYYDFFNIDDKKLGVVIADVSGKGVEASFVMAQIKGIFSSLAKQFLDPKKLLTAANSTLQNNISRKNFVTAIYGIIDLEEKSFNFCRAGHSPVLHYSDGKIERLTPTGLGLGLDYSDYFENSLKELEIKLNNNDIIILFTDGINESVNENLEEFGYDKLQNIIKENSHLSAEIISNKIMEEVSLFTKNSSQHDDITLVLLKCKSQEN